MPRAPEVLPYLRSPEKKRILRSYQESFQRSRNLSFSEVQVHDRHEWAIIIAPLAMGRCGTHVKKKKHMYGCEFHENCYSREPDDCKTCLLEEELEEKRSGLDAAKEKEQQAKKADDAFFERGIKVKAPKKEKKDWIKIEHLNGRLFGKRENQTMINPRNDKHFEKRGNQTVVDPVDDGRRGKRGQKTDIDPRDDKRRKL